MPLGSVRPALTLALSVFALGVGLALLLPWLAARGARPAALELRDRLSGPPVETLVLGSSVAQMGVEAARLPQGLSLASPGTHPAHWLAVWRHHVRPSGQRPRWVVFYAPLESFHNGELRLPAERGALLDLLPAGGDPELERRALGAPVGRMDRLRRWRAQVREGLLGLLTELPAGLGLPGERQAPQGPNQREGAAGLVAEPNRANELTPRSEPLPGGLFDLLLQEIVTDGGRPVVVVPVVRGGLRDPAGQQAVAAWLFGQAVDLVDLSCLQLAEAEFFTPHHLREQGRRQVSLALADALAMAAEVPADAPARLLPTGCRSLYR